LALLVAWQIVILPSEEVRMIDVSAHQAEARLPQG